MTSTHLGDRAGGRAGRRPQALPRPGRDRGRPADGRAGRLGGDHRPALGPAGPPHLDRQPRVDADGLHPVLRRPPPLGRSDRRLLRTQADVRGEPHRVRRCLGAGRPGPERRHALQRPRAAGRLRRHHGARGPLAPHRGLHRAQGAGPRVRRLRRHRRRRGGHRPHPRWLPHRVRLVALDAAHQRADRRHRRRRRAARRPREPQLRPTTATTCPAQSPSPAACWPSSTPSPRRAPTGGAHRSPSRSSASPVSSWSPSC